ncbi:hypothetical protein WG66_005932 [Moniliophthora roreri]|nr:hypothetical protein WG66_005932 [Moniliophthora roreri]
MERDYKLPFSWEKSRLGSNPSLTKCFLDCGKNCVQVPKNSPDSSEDASQHKLSPSRIGNAARPLRANSLLCLTLDPMIGQHSPAFWEWTENEARCDEITHWNTINQRVTQSSYKVRRVHQRQS